MLGHHPAGELRERIKATWSRKTLLSDRRLSCVAENQRTAGIKDSRLRLEPERRFEHGRVRAQIHLEGPGCFPSSLGSTLRGAMKSSEVVEFGGRRPADNIPENLYAAHIQGDGLIARSVATVAADSDHVIALLS